MIKTTLARILLPSLACLLVLSGCRRIRSGGVYEEGIDLLLPIEQDAVTQTVAPAEGHREAGTEQQEEDQGQPETVAVDVLTRSDNPPLPRLNPGVRIDVKVVVAGREEVSERNRPISPQGEIYLPLVKSLNVKDLTREDAVNLLAKSYSKYFRDPEVEIVFSSIEGAEAVSPWGYVTVTGRVKQPRRVPLSASQKLTLSQVITMAGGLDTSAKDKAVRISRKNADGTIEKQVVNLRKIVSSGKLEEDVILQDGDIVFVPETLF